MIGRNLTLAAFAFASLLLVTPVEADFIFGIDGSGAVAAGDTGTLTFFVEATAPDANVHFVGGYTVAYTPGDGVNMGDVIFDPAVVFNGATPLEYNTSGTSTGQLGGGEFIIGSGVAGQMLGDRFNLFSIDYTISGSAIETGQVDVQIDQVQLTDENSDIILGSETATLSGASLTFDDAAVVPEPSGLVLLLAGTGLTVLRRRR